MVLEFSAVELKLVEMVKLGYLLKYQDCLLSAIIQNKKVNILEWCKYTRWCFSPFENPALSGQLGEEVRFFYLGQILP